MYDATMRTTLDLDERLLAVARSRAATRGVTLGQAISELGLLGHDAERGAEPPGPPAGFPMLPPVPGHVITDDMVEQALADDA